MPLNFILVESLDSFPKFFVDYQCQSRKKMRTLIFKVLANLMVINPYLVNIVNSLKIKAMEF